MKEFLIGSVLMALAIFGFVIAWSMFMYIAEETNESIHRFFCKK